MISMWSGIKWCNIYCDSIFSEAGLNAGLWGLGLSHAVEGKMVVVGPAADLSVPTGEVAFFRSVASAFSADFFPSGSSVSLAIAIPVGFRPCGSSPLSLNTHGRAYSGAGYHNRRFESVKF